MEEQIWKEKRLIKKSASLETAEDSSEDSDRAEDSQEYKRDRIRRSVKHGERDFLENKIRVFFKKNESRENAFLLHKGIIRENIFSRLE